MKSRNQYRNHIVLNRFKAQLLIDNEINDFFVVVIINSSCHSLIFKKIIVVQYFLLNSISNIVRIIRIKTIKKVIVYKKILSQIKKH